MKTPLRHIAHARSGDKGASSNVGVIAYTPGGYGVIRKRLSSAAVMAYFKPMGLVKVTRYEVPNLGALNFILHGILDGGGSRSLRVDAQGKALGQAMLEMELELSAKELAACGQGVQKAKRTAKKSRTPRKAKRKKR